MHTQDTNSRTVLFAEDNVLMRMPVAEYLRGCGYKVLEATSATEAIELLEDDTFTIDVVMSNVELAGDGFGIAKWLREHQPGLAIMLTGSTKRSVDQARSLCEDGPMPAPYDAQILHRRLLRIMGTQITPDRDTPSRGAQLLT